MRLLPEDDALVQLITHDCEPGELTGHGPIPASLARRIAADPSGTWRRLVTDRFGRLLDYGRAVYRPPADLTDFVIARDHTSCFPYSDTPARRCELDHQTDWSRAGHTYISDPMTYPIDRTLTASKDPPADPDRRTYASGSSVACTIAHRACTFTRTSWTRSSPSCRSPQIDCAMRNNCGRR